MQALANIDDTTLASVFTDDDGRTLAPTGETPADEPERGSAEKRANRLYWESRRKSALEWTGIPKCYWGGLNAYNPAAHENCAKLRAGVERWVELFEPGTTRRGFYFHGSTGSGKSHLAAGIAIRVLETKSSSVLWRNSQDLFLRIRESWRNHTEPDLMREMVQVGLLIIDDLGTEQPEQWVLEKLYHIINKRLEEGGVMICTSNYAPEQLRDRFRRPDKNGNSSDMGDRIMSRLMAVLRMPQTPFPTVDFRRTSPAKGTPANV
jgi:DNA replication protein DnaC